MTLSVALLAGQDMMIAAMKQVIETEENYFQQEFAVYFPPYQSESVSMTTYDKPDLEVVN